MTHQGAPLPRPQVGFGQWETLPTGSWREERSGYFSTFSSPKVPQWSKLLLCDPSSKAPNLPGIHFPISSSCLFKPRGGKSFTQLLISQHSLLIPLIPPITSETGPFIQVFSSEPLELLLFSGVTLTGTIYTKSHLRDVQVKPGLSLGQGVQRKSGGLFSLAFRTH